MGHAANRFVVPTDRFERFAMLVNGWIVPDGREHRIEREAHKHRDQHRRYDGEAKFVEELANNAAHEANRQKHRDDGQRGGQHRQANFFRTIERGLK